jgi:hypothetical protein
MGLTVPLDALHGMVIADASALINTHSKQTHTKRELKATNSIFKTKQCRRSGGSSSRGWPDSARPPWRTCHPPDRGYNTCVSRALGMVRWGGDGGPAVRLQRDQRRPLHAVCKQSTGDDHD